MSQLVLFYTKQGKFISGRCSDHLNTKAKVRPSGNGNEMEVYCPTCQSTLMLIADEAEVKRMWDRAANVMGR